MAMVFSEPLRYSISIGYSISVTIHPLFRALPLDSFEKKPRERFVIGAEDKRAPEKIYAKVLSSGDDCKALAFKRRIILLGRQQFL